MTNAVSITDERKALYSGVGGKASPKTLPRPRSKTMNPEKPDLKGKEAETQGRIDALSKKNEEANKTLKLLLQLKDEVMAFRERKGKLSPEASQEIEQSLRERTKALFPHADSSENSNSVAALKSLGLIALDGIGSGNRPETTATEETSVPESDVNAVSDVKAITHPDISEPVAECELSAEEECGGMEEEELEDEPVSPKAAGTDEERLELSPNAGILPNDEEDIISMPMVGTPRSNGQKLRTALPLTSEGLSESLTGPQCPKRVTPVKRQEGGLEVVDDGVENMARAECISPGNHGNKFGAKASTNSNRKRRVERPVIELSFKRRDG